MYKHLSTTCIFCFAVVVAVWVQATHSADLTDKELQADAKVTAALSAEAVGDNVSRAMNLAESLVLEPTWPKANWHSGNVLHQDQWKSIAEVQAAIADHPHTAKFQQMRNRLAGNVAGELELARWCLRRRDDVARFYYSRLLASGRLNARLRQEAVKELGLVEYRGRLIQQEWLADFKKTDLLMEKAVRRWQPKLMKWHKALANRNQRIQQFAIDEINKVDDPFFVLVARQYASSPNHLLARALIRQVATFAEYEATQTLTAFAIYSPQYREAAEQLSSRPKHDFVPVLLRQLTSRIDSDWKITQLPGGSSIYSHSLYQEGPLENREFVAKKTFELPPAIFEPRESWATSWDLDDRTKEMKRELAEDLREQAEENEERVDEYNKQVEKRNKAVVYTLETVTDQDFDKVSQWWDWWTEYNEVQFQRPTRSLTRIDRNYSSHQPYFRALSCFAAGTPVVTETGFAPIESIRSGDRVLSQDIQSGQLRFDVVVDTTIRQPSALLRLTINGQTIDTTLGHPFWVNGTGWKMAKLLKVGDYLHSPQGSKRIDAIMQLPRAQPAYNLIVQGGADYFVGTEMVLVHDNTYRNATTCIVPGLTRQQADAAVFK